MNGTPFSVACRAACRAGQVVSLRRIAPDVTAAMKRGAAPNSLRLTADVSSISTQPAPIRRSACSVEVGQVTRCRRRTPRRISARVASIGTPEDLAGSACSRRRSAPALPRWCGDERHAGLISGRGRNDGSGCRCRCRCSRVGSSCPTTLRRRCRCRCGLWSKPSIRAQRRRNGAAPCLGRSAARRAGPRPPGVLRPQPRRLGGAVDHPMAGDHRGGRRVLARHTRCHVRAIRQPCAAARRFADTAELVEWGGESRSAAPWRFPSGAGRGRTVSA